MAKYEVNVLVGGQIYKAGEEVPDDLVRKAEAEAKTPAQKAKK